MSIDNQDRARHSPRAITLRLSEADYQRLKARADAHRRSCASEVMSILDRLWAPAPVQTTMQDTPEMVVVLPTTRSPISTVDPGDFDAFSDL